MANPLVRVAGTGSCLPERRLTNAELAQMVDTTEDWILMRTGIRERRIAAAGEFTSDLAVRAGQVALEAAGVEPNDLDLILVATTTPDLVFPATATMVQRKLGAHYRQAPAFDIQAVCAGFVYAVTIAEKFILSGSCSRVLVIGAETFSRIVDWKDRSTCILFGDGAGAAVLTAAQGEEGSSGILSTHIYADGSYRDLLRVSGGISTGLQPGEDPRVSGVGFVQMRGNEVYKQAVKSMSAAIDDTLIMNGLERHHIDWLVPHQANIRIIESIAKRLEVGMEQVVVTVDRHGNTSAASVPLALDEAVRDGRIKRGDKVLLVAFGGGFTWGSVLIRW
ncbi:MAG: ketoacyl-ACP synthase III [Magnetococcales bacterium]|nr:ketoacyl-ACP synthase III [Magnetococcales bacterium]MBF0156965.1 ketoacyl-ACP synthase III [Magnetococcales bacterium]